MKLASETICMMTNMTKVATAPLPRLCQSFCATLPAMLAGMQVALFSAVFANLEPDVTATCVSLCPQDMADGHMKPA